MFSSGYSKRRNFDKIGATKPPKISGAFLLQEQPPEVFYKKVVLKNFEIFT